jgi:DNA primase
MEIIASSPDGFREAVEVLAKQAGIELTDREEDRSGQQRAQIYDVNEAAAAFFEHVLNHHPAAEPARRYLEQRGIDRASAGQFRLRFPRRLERPGDHLLKRFSLELLLDRVVKRNENATTFDMFHRVIFPIRDRRSRVIGGGRVMDDGVPKYLNTSEPCLSQVACDLKRPGGGRSRARPGRDRRRLHGCDRSAVRLCVISCGDATDARAAAPVQRYRQLRPGLDADAAGQRDHARPARRAILAQVRKPVATPGGVQPGSAGANLAMTVPGKDPTA